MSVGSQIAETAINIALAAVHEVLDQQLNPDDKAKALDAVAERLKFDADGQRKLDARRRQQKGQP